VDALVDGVLHEPRQAAAEQRRGDVLQLQIPDSDARRKHLALTVELKLEGRVGPALEPQAADERRIIRAAEGDRRGDAPLREAHARPGPAGLRQKLDAALALLPLTALREREAVREPRPA